jgi:hypothetical protein
VGSVIRNDHIMRQIASLVRALSVLLLGKAIPVFERYDDKSTASSDRLNDVLIDLIAENRIDEAENMLFKKLEAGIDRPLALTLDFYYRLSLLPRERLGQAGFTLEEIDRGLRDALALIGMADVLDGFQERS